MFKWYYTVILMMAFTYSVFGQTPTIYTVGPGGSPTYDYGTIQDGIDACSTGDKVMVYNGTYNILTWEENIEIDGKDIIIESVSGAGRCIIDGTESGSTVKFTGGCGTSCRLKGFTIKNGDGTGTGYPLYFVLGAGIAIIASGPTIEDCIIEDNEFDGNDPSYDKGGGIYIGDGWARTGSGSSYYPTIKDCIIRDNNAGKGGAIYAAVINVNYYDITIENCEIYENGSVQDGHVFISGSGATTRPDLNIQETKIGENADLEFSGQTTDNAGLWLYQVDVTSLSSNWIYDEHPAIESWYCNTINMINDTYAQNDLYAGEFYWDNDQVGTLNFYNTIVWDNGTNYSIYVYGDDTVTVNVEYCCWEGGENSIDITGGAELNYDELNGMWETDPDFVNSSAFNFHLDSDSDMIDKGYNSASPMSTYDIDGDLRLIDGDSDQTVTVDIGGDEYDPRS